MNWQMKHGDMNLRLKTKRQNKSVESLEKGRMNYTSV
jgi:hypothetical protein